MESPAHQALKHAAAAWASAHGYTAASEVRCPIARYRIDVAAWKGEAHAEAAWPWAPAADQLATLPDTIFIEAKASRSDFLRDTQTLPRLLRRRASLSAHLDEIRREIVHIDEPHLQQRGENLIPDLDPWDYGRASSPTHRLVLTALRRLDQAIHGNTKFFTLARYRLAARLFLIAPRGLIQPGELPPQWGLLEAEEPGDRDPRITEAVPAPILDTTRRHRRRTVTSVQAASSRFPST